MIRLQKVSAGIGRITILRDIDLEVRSGEIVAVLGANGAGKTTLLRVISGIVPMKVGSIDFDGNPIAGTPAHTLARSGLVHVPQGRQIIPALSVAENLTIGALNLPGMTKAELESKAEAEYSRFPVLKERSSIPGGSLSGGEQQMLAISRALMMRPKVLMLDEPSLGLAPRLVARIMMELAHLSKTGIAILLVEQKLAALDIANRAYILKNGQIVHSGGAAQLKNDAAILSHYLS
ncbi:MAG: branched-chain amino acid transport system ATP-binding protein [Alphaproteobacteria bacterium]|jgi:branched-chain amino acid transport system ATP-binding protein|nr:branched-chain amino acid transport system ATP-binding protein [Alphaproteobacteria bacterium]